MKAINPENRMKQLRILSMLLFLLAATGSIYSQHSFSLQGTPNSNILSAIVPTQIMAELTQAAPEAFEPNTLISFSFPKQMDVQLAIYDKYGRELKMLVNEPKNPGTYSVDISSANLKNGVYFYRLSVGDETKVQKILIY